MSSSSNEKESIKTTKIEVLLQLKQHEFYFLSWLRDEHLPAYQVNKMITKIFANVPNDFSEVTELDMVTIQRCGGALVEAFLQIHLRRIGEAEKSISKGEKFLEHCTQLEIIPREYYNGFKFLVSLLRLHLSVIDGTMIDSDSYNISGILKNEIIGFPTLDCLDSDFKPLELAAVLSVRWQLYELFPKGSVKSVDEGLQKMHELDPENWVWSYLLCNRVRCTRRQQSGSQSYPDIREIEAINSACKYCPTNYRPMCTAGLVQCLAEILRWRTFNSFQDELVVGEMKFITDDAIVQFIVKTAKEALDAENICFGELIRYGEIFSSILPVKYRNVERYNDVEIAYWCLRAALLLMPRNSKANHRMGIFQLQHEKNRDLALEFFVLAVRNGPENFPAWLELIQLLLSDLENIKNETILENAFKDVLTTSMKWATTRQRATLLFLRALHYFLKNENERAIEFWVQYNEIDTGNSLHSFSSLSRMFQRFSFKLDSNTILENIKKLFDDKIKTYTEVKEKEKLQVLIKRVRAAVRETTDMVGAEDEINWRSNTNRSFQPIRISQERQRYPTSEADLDNSWRNSPSKSLSESEFLHGINFGSQVRTISPTATSSKTFGAKHSAGHSGSVSQQSQSSYTNNRSAPEIWR